ncbi:MAG: YqeG family HAD IIIA-type phosphatase [Firmicutes bacterium]|nr:YqeG family HAD IIIA-type phosphatase [Bacillota bacterium]
MPFWENLVPHEYCRSIYDIDLEGLRARGITGLILDLDNTLAAWRFGEPEPRLAAWVARAKEGGLRPYIVSNDLGPRVELFSRYLDIPGLARAGKPRRRAFRQVLRELGLRPEQCAVVGDQVFTDILGAKPLGLHTILVVPVSDREFIWTRLVRRLERLLVRRLRARGRLGPPVSRSEASSGQAPTAEGRPGDDGT